MKKLHQFLTFPTLLVGLVSCDFTIIDSANGTESSQSIESTTDITSYESLESLETKTEENSLASVNSSEDFSEEFSSTSEQVLVEPRDMLYGVCYIFSERYRFEENMDKDIQLLTNLGVGSVRLWGNFSIYLKNSTTINAEECQKMHSFVSKLQANGITPIYMNYVSFDHGKDIKSNKYTRDITKNSNYINWLTEYYMSWKTIAKEFSEITYFEVGNEINNGDFMKDINGTAMTSMQEMASISADMLYHASRGIKTSNKEAKVVLGGLTETRRLGSGENVDFLNKLYACIKSGEYGYMYKVENQSTASKDPDDYFDIACWHPYVHGEKITKEQFVQRNNAMYDVILTNEPEGKDVFFTEVGFTDNNQTYDENRQSLIMFYDALKEMPYVKAVTYFKLFDNAVISWVGTYSRWGFIFDPNPNNKYNNIVNEEEEIPVNGSAKPIAYAFQEIAGGSGNLDLLEVKE